MNLEPVILFICLNGGYFVLCWLWYTITEFIDGRKRQKEFEIMCERIHEENEMKHRFDRINRHKRYSETPTQEMKPLRYY